MANEQEIEGWKRAYQSYSDEALIHETHKWIPSCAQHIAAKLVLHERNRRQADESSNRSHDLNLKTYWWAKFAGVLTLAALVLTVVQLVLPPFCASIRPDKTDKAPPASLTQNSDATAQPQTSASDKSATPATPPSRTPQPTPQPATTPAEPQKTTLPTEPAVEHSN